MEILINSDNLTPVGSEQVEAAKSRIEERLDRFRPRLTRIELHLRDLDGPNISKEGSLEAKLEARPAGMAPLAVSFRAAKPTDALNGALGKLFAALDSAFGKTAVRRPHRV